MRVPRHGPNRLDRYQQTHDTILGQIQARGFLCANALEWESMSGEIRLSGEIGCLGDIVIRVDKTLEILGGVGAAAQVQTVEYCYNASIRGVGTFLRVDNSHPYPGHETDNHRHWINPATDKDLQGSPICLGRDWPTLGEFIEEVQSWYWANRSTLPNPDACPRLMLRCAI